MSKDGIPNFYLPEEVKKELTWISQEEMDMRRALSGVPTSKATNHKMKTLPDGRIQETWNEPYSFKCINIKLTKGK